MPAQCRSQMTLEILITNFGESDTFLACFLGSAGKGRGIVATCDLPTGTLLMVTPPLVLITTQMGAVPALDDLIDVLKSVVKLTPWEAAWFTALESGQGSSSSLQAAAELPPMMSPGSSSSSKGGSSSSKGSSSGSSSDTPAFFCQHGGW